MLEATEKILTKRLVSRPHIPVDERVLKKFSPVLREEFSKLPPPVLAGPRALNINALIDTEAVKNAGGPQTVSRLRFTLKEEGLEWADVTNDAGETTPRLLPE
jgi:hypothetical protein